MKVGIKLGKVKKFGIGWCIHQRMAADNAIGLKARMANQNRIKVKVTYKKFGFKTKCKL